MTSMLLITQFLQISIMFAGPEATQGAMPKGGSMIDSYPAAEDNHFEGLLLMEWRKAKHGLLEDATETAVVKYVS
jgi:hypothetical protein